MSVNEDTAEAPVQETSTTERGDSNSSLKEESEPKPDRPKRESGTVKWFSATKGFGFIQSKEGDSELFVHQTSINVEGFRSLREGEPVEFDLETSEGGRAKAVNVTGPNGAAPQGALRRATSAVTYPTPQHQQLQQQAAYPFLANPYAAYPYYGDGRLHGRGMFPGPSFPGRGYIPIERPPPPGTPGVSSGFQVVVHNLPWATTWQELKDIFSHTPGVVRADVIIDATGRSRGFGTVRYKTREDALRAAELMNNAEIDGRVVSVRIDRFA